MKRNSRVPISVDTKGMLAENNNKVKQKFIRNELELIILIIRDTSKLIDKRKIVSLAYENERLSNIAYNIFQLF